MRPLAPILLVLLVLGLITFAILAVATGVWWPLAALTGAWLAWLLFVGVRAHASTVGVMTAAAIMHGSYGIGLLRGLVRGPSPVRRSIGRPQSVIRSPYSVRTLAHSSIIQDNLPEEHI